jgi:CDP-diacylglycerol--serine O-phosphatidyltransferase
MYYFLGGEGATNKHLTLLLLIYVLAVLMVSTIPYYSFKELHLRHREPFWILVLGIIVMSLAIAEPQIMLFSISSLYALSGPLRAVGRLWRTAPPLDTTPELRALRPSPRPLDSNEESSL